MNRLYIRILERQLSRKIKRRNVSGSAVIFIITGVNGSGKSTLAKRLLNNLPFVQSLNLGFINKTWRFSNITASRSLFTKIIKYFAMDYQKNGVNVIIDGTQIDCEQLSLDNDITGGVILCLPNILRLERNKSPKTHFNRTIWQNSTQRFTPTNKIIEMPNGGSINHTYIQTLNFLNHII